MNREANGFCSMVKLVKCEIFCTGSVKQVNEFLKNKTFTHDRK